MQAYYDGTPLLHPNEDVLQYANTDGMFLFEDYFQGVYHTNLDSTEIYSPVQGNLYGKLQLGQLYWPTGAKRFGCGMFLVSSDFLEKLPNNFDVTLYKDLNYDLSHLSDLEAKYHYINNGINAAK